MTALRSRPLRVALLLLLVVAIFFAQMRSAAAAVAAVGAATGNTGSGVTSLTWSHTVSAGSNRLLLVRIANTNTAVTVSSVTFGGAPLTYLTTATNGSGATLPRATVYYLVAPTVSTANVIVTFSASVRAVGTSLSLTGVSQLTPMGTPVAATGTSATPSVTVTGATGDLFADVVAARGTAGNPSAVGGGQTAVYGTTGTTSSDSLGLVSHEAGSASSAMTWTNGASAPWVSVGVAVKAQSALTISGTVFEDMNYGGGAGRNLATSGGTGVNGATVEIYNSSGAYLGSTTTAGGGAYSFTGMVAATYHVRVVNSTVPSQRTGTTGTLRGVQTYRTNASTGSAVAVTDHVGGTNPALVDPGAGSSGTTFNTGTSVFSAGLSGTAQSVAPVALSASNISGVDFGFNFDTVANTNDSGQGSLRQAMTNANTLTGDASLAQSGRTAAKESLIFMISNGTTGSGGSLSLTGGLRTTNNFFSGGVATIAPSSALPTLSTAMILDARAQPGWSSAPIIELNGSGAGASTTGLSLQSITGATVAGLVVRNFGSAGNGSGIGLDTVTSSTIAGNHIGTNAAGTAAAPNAAQGINLWNSSSNTIGGTTAADRNVISGNGNNGIVITGSSGATGNLIRGNYIGTNAAGTGAVANGSLGVYLGWTGNTLGGTAAGAGNVISGNTFTGIVLDGTASNTTIQGNTIGLVAAGTTTLANGDNGIYVASSGNTIGGTTPAARNVISGNASDGVELNGSGATGNSVQGNYIGTDAAGTTARANGGNGVYILASAASNSVGGTAAGAGNLVYGNGSRGVRLDSGTGNAVLGNAIYGNTSIGIDLAGDGATANDGAKTSGQPNLLMDAPVFSTAALSGGTLTLAGHVGSAANQSTFATSRVEVFKSDNSSGAGSGQSYLGFLTADAGGNFSGSLAVSGLAVSDKITGTATDTSNNSSEFGTNATVTAPISVSGTVFEDLNYGGGAGRDLSGSGGVGVNGATVELYNGSGTYVSSTTTAGGGAYSFTGLSASTTYHVRVVNSTVPSQRSGTTAALRGVMTYRTNASSGTAVAVTDHVGGTNPALADPGAASSGAAFNTGTGVFSAGLSGTAQSFSVVTTGSASISGVDFGFNFDTVVNTNDSGQGSLRQVITNANTLGGDASLVQSGRSAAIENLVFMLSNGSAAAGLRSANNYFSGGVATIAPASALPALSTSMVIDAQTQPGWSATPILELNGTSTGGVCLQLSGGSTSLRGWVINRCPSDAVSITGGTAHVIQGNWIGLNNAGTAASAASASSSTGIWLGSASSVQVGGTTAAQRNVISGNTYAGIYIGSSVTSLAVTGNYIGTNAAGTAALGNAVGGIRWASSISGTSGISIGGSTAGQGNVVSGNTGAGVRVTEGAPTISGNYVGLNAAGTAALPNSASGIELLTNVNGATIGGTTTAARNVISGNTGAGISTTTGAVTNVVIRGNAIGTDAAGAGLLANGGDGIDVQVGTAIAIGGTAAGSANVIAGNGGRGVNLRGLVSGVSILSNSIYSNTNIGIDLGNNGATNNDGTTTAGQPNLLMDTPVFTSAALSGGTLTLAGYVGSAAGQSTFASARVEVFVADNSSAKGQGRTYLGFLTANASGNFSGTLAVSGVSTADNITATATDGANNSSEFATNVAVGFTLSGTVFEDLNYGGGAGRSLATSGGTGLAGARVELYDNSGAFVSATTTAAGGGYSFASLGTGAYTVRVVNSTVLSSRTGASASQVGVQTYRTEAASGTAVAVTDHVGGLDPANADTAAGAGGTSLWALCAAENATCTFAGTRIVRYGAYATGSSRWTTRVLTGGTGCNNGVFGDPYSGIGKNCYLLNAAYQSVANVAVGSAAVTGIDFGFNFSTVVNINDSGQGSLRQFITNANALGGKATLAQAGNRRNLANAAQALPAATESSIFMVSGGSAVAGLRTNVPSQLTSGVAPIVITSALPSVTAASVSLDGSTQTANMGDTNAGLLGTGGTVGADALTLSQVARPEVEVTFASLASGVAIAANSVTVRALALRSTGASALATGAVSLSNDTTGAVIEGNLIGTRATALTDPGAGQYLAIGVNSSGADSGTVRNNLIAYFTTTGVQLAGTLSATWTISGNEIRDGGLDFNNTDGIALSSATGVTISGNRIAGISTQAIVFGAGAGSGTQILNNTLTGNGVGPLGAASIQSNVLVARSGASGVRVEANVINANYGAGVAVNSGATGVALTRNLVYGNGTIASRNGTAATGQIDIDLNGASDDNNLGGAPFVSTNDTGDADAGGNNLQNHPVLSSAVISGGTQLIVSGTLNTNASGYYRIEFFGNTSPHASGRGGAQTYLGFVNVASDGSGNASFSTTLTATVAMGSYVTATATKSDAAYTALTETSEFAPNVQAGLSVQGTVFEDVQYGGGAGRTRAASGGVGLDGARVELYDNAGAFVSATTTAAGGAYRFDVPVAGAYLLRVVGSSVPSSRTGSIAGLVGVMTYRGHAASGTVVDVTDFVGGTNPALADPGNGGSGTVLNTSSHVFSAGLTGTAHAVTPITVSSASIAGIDFGFNFDTVVNTNDAGQGSLRQAITNANTLGGDASLAQSGRTAAIENLVFMIGNGTAAAGLRSANNAFTTSAGSYSVATMAPASALPIVTEALVIDAQTQPGWTLNPIIELNGAAAGSNGGLRFNVSGNVVRGLVINRFTGDGINLAAGSNTVAGNWIGVNAAGTAASANTVWGVEVNSSSNTVGGSTAAARNVISGNGDIGIYVRSGSGNVIQGNYIGTNVAGTAAVANATFGVMVHSSTSTNTIGGSSAGQGNLISGNGGAGIRLRSGSGGNIIRGNIIGLNAAASGALPNALGIQIDAAGNNNPIGGTGSGDGNVIAGNTSNGVAIWGSPASRGNAILGNSIYSNGGIGIDLGTSAGTSGNGITANTGAKTTGEPNLLMNHPVFTSARARGSQLTVAGYIGTAAGQSAFASSRVEVFISDSTSTSGSGQTYLGALTADASGNFSGIVTMPYSALRAGSVLTGTATDTANNTSEFGANFSGLIVDWLINHNGDGVDANPGDGLCETSTPGQCTLRAAIMEANAWAGTDLAAFDLPSCPGAGCIITPASALPAITGQLTLDGQTQPGWALAPLVDLRGEGAGAGSDGLTVNAASSIVRGLAVGGFLQSGIRINANNVTVEGVYAGVGPDGVTARANGASNSATGGVYVAGGTGIVIGGTTATTRNVLSGNGGSGVWANAGTATIIGNYIGTNAAGTAALGNGRWGVTLATGSGHRLGGSASGEGNVISGNVGSGRGGVYVAGSGQIIQGNTIGLNAARTVAIPNGNGAGGFESGIDLRGGSGHLIGGLNAGEGNVIAGNQGHGIRVGSQTTRILGNSVYSNLLLGIDLGADGVTANNGTVSGSLPNNDMDHPVITSAGYDPATRALTLTGYVGTGVGQPLFAGARVELFTSDGDATGYGEGSNFVGTLTVDATGRFSGTVAVPVAVTFAVGTALTGTATDTSNNTSEFGPNYVTTTVGALAPSRFNAFETSTAAGALTGVIQTRVAGVAGNIAVVAIDTSGVALQTTFAGSVALDWMNATNNSGALDAGNCRASWVASGSAGSAGSAAFAAGDLGRHTSVITPTTVGREWRLRMTYAGPSGTVMSCSTDAFAVRPDTLAITGVSDTNDTTAGTTRVLDNLAATGGRVHHAGRPFSLRAAARDAASAVATGYDGTPSLAVIGCVLPAGCTAGTLTAPALVANAGLVSADTLSYSEVGAINLQLTDDSFADIDSADTLLAQRRIQSAAVGVGRFVPDGYLLTSSNSAQFATQQGSCAAVGQGFTFVGQNFGWATAPTFTVTAKNAAGGTTALWSGTLQKLASGHIARSLAAANAQGLTPAVTWGAMTLTDTGGGSASVALSGDQFLFARDINTPVPSFNPLITLGIAVSDSSETAVSGNTAISSASALVIGSGTGIAFNQGSNFHYGRLKLQNAFGDVRRGVRANIELQKFSDRGWLRLSEDNTCLTVPQASIAFSAGSGAFATDVCTAPATAAVALRQGRGTLVLPKTVGNIQGAATVTLNIGPTLEGSACAAGVPVSPTSAAWPHLLGARGSGATQDQNPAARLVWGRQHRDYLSQRELF